MDVLSDALRVIRLNGALFLNAAFHEPWCIAAPSAQAMAPALGAPGREYVAICHLVVAGRCWVQRAEDEAVAAEAGDVVVLPHGDAHFVGSELVGGHVATDNAVELRLPELAPARYGGRGTATTLVCGWFAHERRIASPVIGALPALFCATLGERPSSAWLASSIRYAVEEAGSGRPGAKVVADKLAEVLFVEALRAYAESLPDRATGWLAGLRDPVVGRSIALLHEEPTRAWTVASLARAAGVSRTVLADRFTAQIGVPPMQYLTQWRLALAAHLLRDCELGVTQVAVQVGYESEAAFSRAFKRLYGKAPGSWRRSLMA